MKVTNAMTTCYMNCYDFVMEHADDPYVDAQTFHLLGNRLCGMWDMMEAVTERTGHDIPDGIKMMQERYEKALMKKAGLEVE